MDSLKSLAEKLTAAFDSIVGMLTKLFEAMQGALDFLKLPQESGEAADAAEEP